jgi:gamma-glutamyltranspeptidase/glutathione hydrolase
MQCSERYGGLLALEDLAACRAVWQEPISTTYRGCTVFEAPPNSSGHVLLQELNLVEGVDLRSLGCNTAESVHLMVEAKKLAFADREAYLADPDFVDVPLAGLISKAYARERSRLIDPARAAPANSVRAGDPWAFQPGERPASGGRAVRMSPAREDTTCFCVADRWGNAVCQLQSLQSSFGSGLVADGTGVLLNNRMTYWHLDPQHVDCLQPGKRVRHTMNPVMVFRDGQLLLVLGTPGADTQVQTNLQLITLVLDFGMTPVEAVEAPRWRHIQSPTESTVPHTAEDALTLEARFPEEVRRELSRRGHPVQVIGPWAAVGSAMLIQVDPATGGLWGAADPRRDGYAIGW